ncbi:MAG: ABC transporter permease [Candidatus Thorarchaeota archaeon]
MVTTPLGQPLNQVRSSGSFWRQLVAMSKKELTIRSRYPIAVISDLLEMIFIVFFFVFAAKAFIPTGEEEFLRGTQILSGTSLFLGFLIYFFIQSGLYVIGQSLRSEQITGTLESLYLSPGSSLANMLSRVVYTILILIVFTPLVYVLTILFIGDIQIQVGNLPLWLYFFSTLLGIVGVSFALAGFALKIKEAMQPLLGLIEFSLLIFSGVFLPLDILGPGVFISILMPPSYGIDLLRSSLSGTTEPVISKFVGEILGIPTASILPFQILFVGVSGLIFPFLGLAIFNRMIRSAQKKGSLAEF